MEAGSDFYNHWYSWVNRRPMHTDGRANEPDTSYRHYMECFRRALRVVIGPTAKLTFVISTENACILLHQYPTKIKYFGYFFNNITKLAMPNCVA